MWWQKSSVLESSINTIKERKSTQRKYYESHINFLANFKEKVVGTKCCNKSESKLLWEANGMKVISFLPQEIL